MCACVRVRARVCACVCARWKTVFIKSHISLEWNSEWCVLHTVLYYIQKWVALAIADTKNRNASFHSSYRVCNKSQSNYEIQNNIRNFFDIIYNKRLGAGGGCVGSHCSMHSYRWRCLVNFRNENISAMNILLVMILSFVCVLRSSLFMVMTSDEWRVNKLSQQNYEHLYNASAQPMWRWFSGFRIFTKPKIHPAIHSAVVHFRFVCDH